MACRDQAGRFLGLFSGCGRCEHLPLRCWCVIQTNVLRWEWLQKEVRVKSHQLLRDFSFQGPELLQQQQVTSSLWEGSPQTSLQLQYDISGLLTFPFIRPNATANFFSVSASQIYCGVKNKNDIWHWISFESHSPVHGQHFHCALDVTWRVYKWGDHATLNS